MLCCVLCVCVCVRPHLFLLVLDELLSLPRGLDSLFDLLIVKRGHLIIISKESQKKPKPVESIPPAL